jgi:hypothetical protein
MTSVAIVPIPSEEGVSYCAIAGSRQSSGKTAGQALDALNDNLSEEERGTLVIVQHHRPDQFFTASQQGRLQELMARWRAARDTGSSLPVDEQNELSALVDAELRAAADRAARLGRELAK